VTVVIRPETSADVPVISRVTHAAFQSTSRDRVTEHRIVEALRRNGALSLSLVAVDDGHVVGHVAVSPFSISSGASGWFGLGPISVLPARQRQGIGTRLMERALAMLLQRGARGCVLVGEPAFYGRFGFAPKVGLEYPSVPAKFFLALPFGPERPSGTVQYDAAFAES